MQDKQARSVHTRIALVTLSLVIALGSSTTASAAEPTESARFSAKTAAITENEAPGAEDHEPASPETLSLEVSSGQTLNAHAATLPGTKTVHRFWSPVYHSHFYTMDNAEVDRVMTRWPNQWHYEGARFQAFDKPVAGTVPVHRFWSEQYKSHFYTTSATEKADVIRKWPKVWAYEGIAYYAYLPDANLGTAIYRFWSEKGKAHFYTSSAAERADVNRRWPTVWADEGARMRVSDFPRDELRADARTVIILCDSQCDGNSWGEQGARANGFTNIVEHSVGGIGYAQAGGWVGMSMPDAITSARIRLPQGSPGLVMLTLGGNDAGNNRTDSQVIFGVRRLVAQAKAMYPNAKLVINGVMSKNDSSHARRRHVDQVVTREATRLGVAAISVAGWASSYNAQFLDQTHLSQRGHDAISRHYAAALSRALGLKSVSADALSSMASPGTQASAPSSEELLTTALSDGAWVDTDRDGIRSDGEHGIEGLIITLLDSDGAVIEQFVTDSTGHLPVAEITSLAEQRVSIDGSASVLYGLEHVSGLGFAPSEWALEDIDAE